ncbi:MATE family efflux transporter [uncultured Ruthenibacterium sp.]|uniref:MATE family efflux transporter n=1 Tax=uncultured Ruthenibacterium sp. TaxID=1905347 RepID=UPI00349EAB4C
MQKDLTVGSEKKAMLLFAAPLILGNIFQQLYNVVDTWVVGYYVSADALAAVGTSFSLLTFLNSILIGLCMGVSVAFSMYFGSHQIQRLRQSIFLSGVSIGLVAVIMEMFLLWTEKTIVRLLQVDPVIFDMTLEYLHIVFWGIVPVFIYNFFAALVRSMGNSKAPVVFVALSAVINIGLDIWFVAGLRMGVAGAAWATLIAQVISAIGMAAYAFFRTPELRLCREDCSWNGSLWMQLANYASFTALQQSVMNFGILMIQGLVNSFGVAVTAAFAAAVKIDSFAYMPVQDFGNAFSTFIAQNYGAKKMKRIQRGIRFSIAASCIFSAAVSVFVFAFASQLMRIFFLREKPKFYRLEYNISILRVLVTLELAFCSYFMVCIEAWDGPLCRWS